MSYETREISIHAGKPVRLYEFERGALRWSYCTAVRDLSYLARTWRALPIRDDGVRLTGEPSADALRITAPADIEVAAMFRAAPPSAEIGVVVRDYHAGEADVAESARAVWVGSISGVRWPQQDRCEIACESMHASMERTGLRLTWERNCPYTIYDQNCRVPGATHEVLATVQSLDGAAISAGAFGAQPDGFFAGGFVRWSIGGGEYEQRGVESHVGDELVLLGGTHGLAGGVEVAAYPGCRQTRAYCVDQFANGANFGGAEHMPGKSPYDGNPVM
ncbi:MAG: phage BR0599 family protein [Proteobacteria bacterium]|nr:phage BR0599 family protein [Pseudomonadota bacterium]